MNKLNKPTISQHPFTIDDQPIDDNKPKGAQDPKCILYCRPVFSISGNDIDVHYDLTLSGIYNRDDIDAFVKEARAEILGRPDYTLRTATNDRLGFFANAPCFIVFHLAQRFAQFARKTPAAKVQLLPVGNYWDLTHVALDGSYTAGHTNDDNPGCVIAFFSADVPYPCYGDKFNLYMELYQDGQPSLLKVDPDIKNDGKNLF
jgi:hypothetical protein